LTGRTHRRTAGVTRGSWQPPQHVAITGAAGAIGGALARAMRRTWPSCELALVDRDAAGLAALATELRGDTAATTTHACELTNLDALPALVETIEAAGPLDGLVNCAGVMLVQQLSTWRWQDAWSLLALDLLAPLRLQDLVARAMAERGTGTIVNVASMAGRVPLRGCAYSGAAKAGLAMASEIARAELGASGVRVVTVYPGPVRSALEQGARDAYGGGGIFGRLAPTGNADVLATRIVHAVLADEARVIYPRLYGVGWIAPNISRRVALDYGPPPVS
jgi:short-subunit dehydrogenase